MSQNTTGSVFGPNRPQDNVFSPGWPPRNPQDYLRQVYWPEFSELVKRVEALERRPVVEEPPCEFLKNLICVS